MRYLREYEIGETFTGFFVLRRKELRTTRNGQPYLMLEIGDRSGRLSGNIWDDAITVNEDLIEGSVIKVQGRIETYQGAKQVSFKRLRKVRPDDEIDPANLIPASDSDPNENLNKIEKLISGFSNEHLKQLITAFLDDDTFRKQFLKAPAGKLWHHNRLGGLIEHTLSMCQLCVMLADHYPEIDKDLLVSGAILHDIGKVEEYNFETFIDYSDRGRLVGHITLGAQWVVARAAQIDNFPPELLDRLQHLILSHQGEHGSPVMPSTREAFLLHYIDLIDSKMDALRRITKDLPEGERWTFVKLLGQFVDLSSPEEQ